MDYKTREDETWVAKLGQIIGLLIVIGAVILLGMLWWWVAGEILERM